MVRQRIAYICVVVVCTLLTACTAPPRAQDNEIESLARSIQGLGPQVDPAEAHRAAQIAYTHAHELTLAYEITDPPLVHNTKVNMGLKPRGLCWHWAEDMEKRLLAEGFKTLDIQRAIANSDDPLRIDHSTALVTARGQPIRTGIVLDPWRNGGALFWAPVGDDTRYAWRPQHEVLAKKYALTPLAN